MLVFPRRVEHPFDVTVEGSHHACPREHRRPVMFCDQQKSLHGGLPFFGIVFCLGQFANRGCIKLVKVRSDWLRPLRA
jgi:hypothetical protein